MKYSPPIYCTPDEVAETIDLPDPNDNYGSATFSDLSHPSYKQVCRMIKANEDMIDLGLKQSQRENQVKNKLLDIPQYWRDANGWRFDQYQQGGNEIQLMPNILEWDVSKGDKIEIRTRQGKWILLTGQTTEASVDDEGNTVYTTTDVNPTEAADMWFGFWFDRPMGRLFIHKRSYLPEFNSLRISYRYGQEVPYLTDDSGEYVVDDDGNQVVDYDNLDIPWAINRLCCLMTAKNVINMQPYLIKVGAGGDISAVKQDMFRVWDDEMARIWASLRRVSGVYGLTG